MKFWRIYILVIFSLVFVESTLASHTNYNRNFFIENKGQWPKEVKYLAQTSAMNAWITNKGVLYDYYLDWQNTNKTLFTSLLNPEITRTTPSEKLIVGHVVKTSYDNCNSNPKFQTENKLKGYYNYFLDNDKSHWESNVPIFESVIVKNIYDGIDIRYYFDNGYLRYDFILKPYAKYKDICITIEGGDNIEINSDGSYGYETSIGKVINKDIIAFQNDVKIKSKFFKSGPQKIGLEVNNYDINKELIIDPLVYATFIGGSIDDRMNGIKLDSENNVVITGFTRSSNYPTTIGAYQTESDLSRLITKLNSDGSSLIFSTLLGKYLEISSFSNGSGTYFKSKIEIDDENNIYLTGTTTSPLNPFPTTVGAYRTTGIGLKDVFITKLNSTGTELIYSTYLGGGNNEWGVGVVIDNKKNVYVTGITASTTFPTTPNAFQNELQFDRYGNQHEDIFISKFNSDASKLLYSTYLGGGSESESVRDIAIDPDSNIYITGNFLTFDSDDVLHHFPTTPGAFDRKLNNPIDGFVSKLNYNLSSLVFSTYLGGNGGTSPLSISLDDTQNVYIGGGTSAPNFPTTAGSIDENYNCIYSDDGFVTKLNQSGSSLIYSTYINTNYNIGDYNEIVRDICVDQNGFAYITGYCAVTGFPTTSGSYLPSGNYGGFCSIINSTGSAFLYSSYLCTEGQFEPYNITFDEESNIYLSGNNNGLSRAIVSVNAYQKVNRGGVDGYVMKIKPEYENILLNSKIFLEGPFVLPDHMEGMNKAKFPLQQPYNTYPWNYNGTESSGTLLFTPIDWVLVELRDKNNPTVTIATRAAFLMSNGEICDLDGISPVSFDAVEDDYFIVIKHRNHLPVMSSGTVHLTP